MPIKQRLNPNQFHGYFLEDCLVKTELRVPSPVLKTEMPVPSSGKEENGRQEGQLVYKDYDLKMLCNGHRSKQLMESQTSNGPQSHAPLKWRGVLRISVSSTNMTYTNMYKTKKPTWQETCVVEICYCFDYFHGTLAH